MDSLAEMIAMMWCYFLILFSFLCMWETLISVNLLMSWRRLNKPKRRQNWLVSTSRQVFRQKIYPHSISIFHAVKIWSFGERSSQILWLFLIFDLFPSFIQSVALPFGPGHRWHWLKKRKSFNSRSWKFKLQNQMFSSFHIMESAWRRVSSWRLGQACWSCHLTSTGAKWLSPMLTPALVVPCWLDQLTIREVQFLLEPSELNEYQDISYHQ